MTNLHFSTWREVRVCLLGAVLALVAAAASGQDATAVIAAGQKLFEKQWVAGEPAQPFGDGLGPVFNHVSCAACHRQGGLGGGGPADVNAVMLSVEVPKLAQSPQRKQFLASLMAVHPGFLATGDDITENVILHRFGTDSGYGALRANLVGKQVPFQPTDDEREALQRNLTREPVRPIVGAVGIKLAATERNTPALFGARLIDAIPDAALQLLAASQASHPEVSGRVPPFKLVKAGRFGWRGQIDHLHEFVLGACANELGLEVPGHSQPLDPRRPDYRPAGLDLSQEECLSLTAFVASLPAPKFVMPPDADRQSLAENGHKLFHNIGCSACHIEDVGQAQGIFSDLLLHDLGAALADPVLAQPTMVAVNRVLMDSRARYQQEGKLISDDVKSVPYYGGVLVQTIDNGTTYQTEKGITTIGPSGNKDILIKTKYEPLPTRLAQEWRTPPLWGVADSAPYLHDGRAATLVEAIALHGGEAEQCTQRFLALPVADRLAMLEFLSCLRAP
ncbi:MAG: hypothetical protein L0211_22385 [Planctomycetaceae bacterium]|nr:hypothetical protein [Planctomycetaceae bacterium]